MSISKKLRFEVFKRDGFKCAYCGRTPPSVTLEVDHIQPKSKGGKNDINNYVTACFDCNRGKRDIPLDKIPAQLSQNMEVLKEKEEQIKEYRKFVLKIERREKRDIEDVSKIYRDSYPEWDFSDNFKYVSIKKFIQLLPKHKVMDSLRKSVSKFPYNKDTAIRYFCGICWREIKDQTAEVHDNA